MDHLPIPSPTSDRHYERHERRRRSHSLSEIRNRRRARDVNEAVSDRLQNNWPINDLSNHYGPPLRMWHRRPQSPHLHWHKKYTEHQMRRGRVLVIDYVRQDLSKKDTRQVVAQEFHDVESLKRFYDGKRRDEAALRVIHVQNAPWAVTYLFRKFKVVGNDDLVDSDFAKWVCYRHPARGGSRHPLLGARTWQTQHDPWRGVSKTSFGFDYLKLYEVADTDNQIETDPQSKMMELNCYDETTENPMYGYDAYGQRLGVYVQHKEGEPRDPNEDDNSGIENPYKETEKKRRQRDSGQYVPDLGNLDNGNAIIIIENSKSESIDDTLIAARDKWESRWRRLPFYLAYDAHEIETDDQTVLLCARTVLADVFRALADNWASFINKAGRHVEILEAKIYERPADESRADEIWRDSSSWLRCERLAYMHQNLVDEVGANLREMSDDEILTDSLFLRVNVPDFARINNLVQEDLVKPTNNLSDLMYKSVAIRDTRHGLELSYSMWRLSWITFIFLPLTFTVGFFGMNVDTFQNDPSINWFFISSVPLMVLVLILWFGLKWALTASRYDPYSRGVYERLFHDLAVTYPTLWTRVGPLAVDLQANGYQRLKWALVRHWNQPESTVRTVDRKSGVKIEEDRFDGLGAWSRCKRVLTRRWTAEIQAARVLHAEIEKGGPATATPIREGVHAVQQFVRATMPTTTAQSEAIVHGWKLPGGRAEHPGQDPFGGADPMLVAMRPAWLSDTVFHPSRQSPEIRANGGLVVAGGGQGIVPDQDGEDYDPVPFDLNHRVGHVRSIGSPLGSDRRPSSDTLSRSSGVMVEEHCEEDWAGEEEAVNSGSDAERSPSRPRQDLPTQEERTGEAESSGLMNLEE